ncbi:hypothetical protein Syun_017609 [Stephania yunnanensis]|uniref:Uncharacterized protein n=1 Tax=Stephania yunnanensis TaxID=152371 RepID=A0AAP0P2J8_9MAGN
MSASFLPSLLECVRNFTTPYDDQEYNHIFNLAAHNLSVINFTKSFTVDALKDRFAASDQKIYFKWIGDYVKKRISVEGIEGMLEILIEEPQGEFKVLVPFGGINDGEDKQRHNSIPSQGRKSLLYRLSCDLERTRKQAK